MGPVIAVVILFVLAWMFLVLPARRRQRSHRAMQDGVGVGDEIITAGGVHGMVREASPEELRLEIAPGVVVTLDRRAVAAVGVEEPAVADVEPTSAREPAATRAPSPPARAEARPDR